MPLDPNISLSYQPPQIQSPLATMAQVQQLKNQQLQSQTAQLELQEKQRQLQAQDAMGAAMANAFRTNPDGSVEFDTQKIAQGLTARGAGYAVPGMVDNLNKANASIADLQKKRADLLETQNDLKGFTANAIKEHFSPEALIGGVTALSAHNLMDPNAANQAVQDVQAHANDLAYLHQKYDPLIDQLTGASKGVQTMRGALLRGEAQMGELERKQKADAINVLAGATNDEEFKQKLQSLKAAGTPDSALQEFAGKTWTPDLQFELRTRNAPANDRAGMAMAYARNNLPTLLQAAQAGGESWKQTLGNLPKPVQNLFSGLGDTPTRDAVLQAVMTPAELAKQAAEPTAQFAQYAADYRRQHPNATAQEIVRQYAIDSQAPQRPPQVIMLVPNAQGGATATIVRPGTEVAPGAVSVAGYNALNVPTSTERNMIDKAPKVLQLANRIDEMVTQQQKSLGPAASRWNEFMTRKVGAPNADFTKLMTDTDLLSSLITQMHVGSRPSEKIDEKFQKMIDTGKQSPENLHAALAEIKRYAQEVGQGGGVMQARIMLEQGGMPKATQRYNPQTGKLEAIP